MALRLVFDHDNCTERYSQQFIMMECKQIFLCYLELLLIFQNQSRYFLHLVICYLDQLKHTSMDFHQKQSMKAKYLHPCLLQSVCSIESIQHYFDFEELVKYSNINIHFELYTQYYSQMYHQQICSKLMSLHGLEYNSSLLCGSLDHLVGFQ